MIDVRQAVGVAKNRAADMLGQGTVKLEEIERETYRDREVWSITLSFPRDLDQLEPIARVGADPFEYKRFLIDVQTGDLVAMKLREPAAG